jgi:hypothetical protein
MTMTMMAVISLVRRQSPLICRAMMMWIKTATIQWWKSLCQVAAAV